jgi:hypothetical protein
VPLILKRNEATADPDRFLVYSGKAVVGTLMRVPSGEKLGWWHWSITGFHVSLANLGPSAGMSPSQEEGRRPGGLCQAVANLAGVGGVEGTRG